MIFYLFSGAEPQRFDVDIRTLAEPLRLSEKEREDLFTSGRWRSDGFIEFSDEQMAEFKKHKAEPETLAKVLAMQAALLQRKRTTRRPTQSSDDYNTQQFNREDKARKEKMRKYLTPLEVRLATILALNDQAAETLNTLIEKLKEDPPFQESHVYIDELIHQVDCLENIQNALPRNSDGTVQEAFTAIDQDCATLINQKKVLIYRSYHLTTQTNRPPSDKVEKVLILLHGIATDGSVFDRDINRAGEITDVIQELALDETFYISTPRAPFPCHTPLRNGFQWGHLGSIEHPDFKRLRADLDNAFKDSLIPYIQKLSNQFPEAEIILGGFSQGAIAAIDVANQIFSSEDEELKKLGEKIKKIISLSGACDPQKVPEDYYANHWEAKLVFSGHHPDDVWVRREGYTETKDRPVMKTLRTAGATVLECSKCCFNHDIDLRALACMHVFLTHPDIKEQQVFTDKVEEILEKMRKKRILEN